MANLKPVGTEHELVFSDIFDAVSEHHDGMLGYDATSALTHTILTKLNDEGWLIIPPICEHREYDTNARDCETPVRPGQDRCERHQ